MKKVWKCLSCEIDEVMTAQEFRMHLRDVHKLCGFINVDQDRDGDWCFYKNAIMARNLDKSEEVRTGHGPVEILLGLKWGK